MIHRYLEINQRVTFAIADNLAVYDEITGVHNICNVGISRCYTRTLYFVLSTVTSIGYGDIMPYGKAELIWEIILSIIGALISAVFGAYCGAYLSDLTLQGDSPIKKKLAIVQRYIDFRRLDDRLGKSIIAQYKYKWKCHASICEDDKDLLKDLSDPLRISILFEINRTTINSVPWLYRNYSGNRIIFRRLASILDPQVLMIDNIIIKNHDISVNLTSL
jgi:voltage-gated potassium channel